MADDPQKSPPVGRRNAPVPPSISEDWRVLEGRRQVVLRVALEAMFRKGGVEPHKTKFPPPLLADLDVVARKHVDGLLDDILLDRRRGSVKVQPRTSREVEQDIKSTISLIHAAYDGALDRGTGCSPMVWSLRDWIGSWIESGEMIRRVREVINRIKVDDEKKAKAAAARNSSLLGWVGWVFRLGWVIRKTGGVQSPYANQVSLSTRLSYLLATLKELSNARQNPAFWCADQAGPLRLSVASFDEMVEGSAVAWMRLDQPANDRRGCLERLVAIAGTYRSVTAESGEKDSCPHDLFQQWRNTLVADAEKLLNVPCETDPNMLPTLRTRTHWEVKKIVGDGDVNVLVGPLFATSPDRRLLAKGLVVLPGTKSLVARMRKWCEETTPEVETSEGRLKILRLTHGLEHLETLLPSRQAPWPARDVVEALSSCARLLVAIEWGMAGATDAEGNVSNRSLAPLQQYRLAAMLEGVYVVAGDEKASRQIPWCSTGSVGGYNVSPRLHLPIQGVKNPSFTLGILAEPAQCPPDIFDAVEDLDWKLWAIRAASSLPSDRISDENRKSLSSLLACIKIGSDTWENVKKVVLLSAAAPEKIVRIVLLLVVDGLRLEQRNPVDEIAAALLGDTRRCMLALLGRLHEIDREGLGGLDPPRERGGTVDVVRWRDIGGCGDASVTWRVTWRQGDEPFGTQLEERLVPAGRNEIQLCFSASHRATDADLRILDSPFVAPGPAGSIPSHLEPIAAFGRECVVGGAGVDDIHAHITAGLERLRHDLAGSNRAQFDALIHAATALEPESHAVHWVKLLRDDPRFAFDCHPPIESVDEGKTFRVRPATSGERLEWQDDAVEAGRDVRVEYAIEKEHSLRVMSRGLPAQGSPERRVAELVDMCRRDLPAVVERAEQVRRGIDLLRTFPDERPRWSRDLGAAIGAVLDGLVELAASHQAHDAAAPLGKDAPLGAVFETMVRIGAACGYAVTPGAWHPRAGATPDVVTDAARLAVAFHPTVPTGAVIVDRFGIQGDSGRECRCRLSAGWPDFIEGYERLRTLVGTLTGDAPRVQELRQGIEDLPRHVLGEKARLAMPSLYESVWNVLIEHPAAAGDPAPWREAIAELIRKPYDMVMFEPAKLGDYPAAWIVAPDGKPPRGRRIARVVRPGVRTLEKKLVWPAIVETE